MRGQDGLAIVSVLALVSIPRVAPAGCRSPKITNAMCDGNYSSIEGCVNAIWNDLRFDPHASVLPAIRLLSSANEYEYRNISPSRNATWRWDRIVLCERGIRTFETATRNTLDLSAVPLVKSLTHLPVVVDPSHGTGKKPLIMPMAMAAVAAGSDGILIEVHPKPEEALSDGDQSLVPAEYRELVKECGKIAKAIDRTI